MIFIEHILCVVCHSVLQQPSKVMMMIDAKKSKKKLTRPHEVWVQNRYTPIPLYFVGQNKFMTKPDTATWQRAWIKQG